MRPFILATALLLAAACAPKQVSVTTPATPPRGPIAPGTPAPATGAAAPPNVAEPDNAARPAWLEARIAAVLAERKRNPITRIFRYQYGGKAVYYISAPCCDQYSQVFDTKGTLVCQPDGGITGKGDGQCPDFEKNKSNEKLVWQDPR